MASIAGEVVTCPDTGDHCINSGNYNPTTKECSWTRKLCVTCENTHTADARITVQSNGLPAKCFYAPDQDIVEQNI